MIYARLCQYAFCRIACAQLHKVSALHDQNHIFHFCVLLICSLLSINFMQSTVSSSQSGKGLSARSITIWRIAQTLVWLTGLAIFFSLIYFPSVGLLVFWNMLIPVAPALLVVATGLWRNICPLATTNLLPRHFNLSEKRKMSPAAQARLQLIAIVALYTIVPLRHVLFNTNGMATALLLFVAASIGFGMGFVFDWKSGWCSTLCPVHPVEKLYGGKTLISFPNAHCGECVNCSVPCPDSTPDFHPALAKKTDYQNLNGILTIGGLPGFIWGWFHVPAHTGSITVANFLEAYQMPLAGLFVTMMLYLALKNFVNKKNERWLINGFAAAGVSCYYWYRIPALLGFGKFSEEGTLVNLNGILPQWSIALLICASTLFFFSWFLLRKQSRKSWVIRPAYAR